GAILRSEDRRPLHAPGEGSGSHRTQEAHQRDRENRARARVLHPGHLVGAERRALGEGEELRGAAESLLEPETPGRVAQRGLSVVCKSTGFWRQARAPLANAALGSARSPAPEITITAMPAS